jgi:hypothetical protein
MILLITTAYQVWMIVTVFVGMRVFRHHTFLPAINRIEKDGSIPDIYETPCNILELEEV